MKSDQDLEFNNAPNMLTLLRILFVPGVVLALGVRERNYDFLATLLFVLASITDYLDGYLARKYKIETVYGKLMDPLADKFLVLCSLIALQDLGRISPFIVMLLACREMGITSLRALASAEGIIMGASGGGKWKTALQMIAIPMLMLQDVRLEELFITVPTVKDWIIPFQALGMIMLYISLGFSLWSAKDYIVEFFKEFKKARKIRREIRLKEKLAKRALRKNRTDPGPT
jgi:CDP-diacylglycerol--glycerol-3-phosphate 3-phosphatidyltransferase